MQFSKHRVANSDVSSQDWNQPAYLTGPRQNVLKELRKRLGKAVISWHNFVVET
jgi:hypothetical protein